jgi:hypothetical protein
MKLNVLTAPEAATETGLAGPPGGAPAFQTIAAWLRSTVVLKGALRREELVDLAAAQAAMVGLDAGATRARTAAALSVLEAAGDLVAIPTRQGSFVVSPDEETVLVTAQSGCLVGGSESERGRPETVPTGGLLRPARDTSYGRSLDDYLGLPGYVAILREQGLPDRTDLEQAARLLAATVRTNGQPVTPASGSVWGRLDNEGCAYGVLPDGREAILAIKEDGSVLAMAGSDVACWMALAARGPTLLADWTIPHPLPDQLLRALALLGEPLDDTLRCWRLGEDSEALFRAWARLPLVEEREARRDIDQEAVVDALPGARLLVEAPPGSGKTRVACERVASLIDRGTPPARIWMISFTRTAVAEMRDRIARLLGEPVRAGDIRIVTIDSLAWRLRTGGSADEDGSGAGYEAGIRETTTLLQSGDVQLTDFIAGIEHLVVDEAQDLTGDRARLVAALVAGLSPRCGVTLFHDPAQAIYGFSNGGAALALAETLAADPALLFGRASLRTDHRTRDPHLADTFVRLRKALMDGSSASAERYDTVRSIIESAAGAPLGDAAGSGAFVLFRSRAEMLAAASDMWRAGRDFRVRFAARQEIVMAWVGAVLAPCRTDTLGRDEFHTLWRRLMPVPLVPRDLAWSQLRRIAGTGSNAVDVRRLAQRLVANPPPLEVQQTDLGPPTGPLLTTIHGAKGREADEVRLMLSRRPEDEPRGGWDEEARILFVGATRARSRLVVGSSNAFLRRQEGTGRRWQKWVRGGRSDARVEIGIDGDVDPSPPALAEDGTDEAQALLWRHSWRPLAIRAERQEGTYVLKADEGPDEGRRLGALSRDFTTSLRSIAAEASGPGAGLPRLIRGFHMVAARTLALRAPDGTPTFWLAPVIAGLPVIYLHDAR